MGNPTVVVLTDRNDLDDQLFGTFSRCRDLLRQPPAQAENRADLREKLSVAAGGVVFTTIQKFLPDEKGDRHPVLSERRNIVVIADEAHRSQYDFIDGFARHMRDALPSASFIGFTGTPIEQTDANTRAVFGDYISVYDIQRAVEDRATVPIYYESRLAKLGLDESEKPRIDPDFEDVTEGEEVQRKEKLKSKWAQIEAVAGAEKRLALVARDLVEHFEQRLSVMDGKAMVVCMSRRICMDLHDEIVKLRPDWFHEGDEAGKLKVVMTGNASEGPRVARHARNKARREALAKRFRDPRDPFQMVIVRDMWLTGFDAPALHTMYVDKPMHRHGLMQAIARVNRVFRDKPGGLVVDAIGLAHELQAALAIYTESGGTGKTAIDQQEAVAVMLEKHEICCALFHGFDRSKWVTGSAQERLSLLPGAQEHVLALEDGKDRLLRAVHELSQAFALAVPHEQALRIGDDVAFFQAVRASLAKRAPGEAKSDEELDHAVRQIVSRAVASEGVVDIFAAAGLKKPDLAILSDEFLAEVRGMPQRNLAVELLRKLLSGEVRSRRRKNVVQARSFAQMLEQSIRRYQNRAVEAAQVIEELIALARDMRAAEARGEQLGLSEDELAFYDALETNDSAVKVLGDETLRGIARELVATVRANVTVDWTLRENVRAHLRVLVKRILRNTATRPTSRRRRRRRCWNRRRCCRRSGRLHDPTGLSTSRRHCAGPGIAEERGLTPFVGRDGELATRPNRSRSTSCSAGAPSSRSGSPFRFPAGFGRRAFVREGRSRGPRARRCARCSRLRRAGAPHAAAVDAPGFLGGTLGGDAERDQLLVERVRQPLALLAAVVAGRTVLAAPQAAGEDPHPQLRAARRVVPGGEAALDDAAGLVRTAQLADVLRLAVQLDAAGERHACPLGALLGTASGGEALVVDGPREVLATLLARGRHTVLLHAFVEHLARAGGAVLGVAARLHALAEHVDRVPRAAPPAPRRRRVAERLDAARLGLGGELFAASRVVPGGHAPIVEVRRVVLAALLARRRLALGGTGRERAPRAGRAVLGRASGDETGLVDRVRGGPAAFLALVGEIGLRAGDGGERRQREADRERPHGFPHRHGRPPAAGRRNPRTSAPRDGSPEKPNRDGDATTRAGGSPEPGGRGEPRTARRTARQVSYSSPSRTPSPSVSGSSGSVGDPARDSRPSGRPSASVSQTSGSVGGTRASSRSLVTSSRSWSSSRFGAGMRRSAMMSSTVAPGLVPAAVSTCTVSPTRIGAGGGNSGSAWAIDSMGTRRRAGSVAALSPGARTAIASAPWWTVATARRPSRSRSGHPPITT